MPETIDSNLERSLDASWFGLVEYGEAWDLQRSLFAARSEGRCGDTLMLLEHPHTYTLGRRAVEEDLVYDAHEREQRDIALYRIDRGGRATYHGPGQLVGYPIVALGERYDVLSYLRKLETALIETVRDYGVEGTRDEQHTGVWVGDNKIAAIGVKITRGVTMHGFALNVTTDLSLFEGIVPCGLTNRWVTSIESETGRRPSVEEVADVAAKHCARMFERDLVWVDPRRLIETTKGSGRDDLHG
jgi:lipoate-protein ligase B